MQRDHSAQGLGDLPKNLHDSFMLVYDSETNRLVNSDKLLLVNRLLKFRESQDIWKVIGEIVNIWLKSHPVEWKSFIIHLKAVKSDQKRTRIGKSTWRGVSRTGSIERSLVLDMPNWILLCIRKLYTSEELPFDKKFYRQLADKFPVFRIREKV